MVGTKWYKCDLHLYAPASKCFRDREDIIKGEVLVKKAVIPEQLVQDAILM